MRDIHILAFTHRQLEVSQVGKLHIEKDSQKVRLSAVKKAMGIDELMFISTCNRVEYIFKVTKEVDEFFIQNFLKSLYPEKDNDFVNLFSASYEYYQEINAVKHILKVSSSIDSMIVGEREIITQVRKSYEDCKSYGITGDNIRLLVRFTIETAKRIYTETNIADRPVSVVSLAYHTLRKMEIPLDARILVVGAGITNTNMVRFLKKHGFHNFTIFNRTLRKAEKLASFVNGSANELIELGAHKEGFDILITCTGAEEHIITPVLYEKLLVGENDQKVVIDIAVPHDLHPEVKDKFLVEHISVDYLQDLSRKNLRERTKEIIRVDGIIAEAILEFKKVYREREVELEMRKVPQQIKQIKSRAIEKVFKEDLDKLDQNSKDKLFEIIDYFEKKYVSIPMKMAKKIILEK